MNIDFKTACGYLAMALALACYGPYCASIARGATKPHMFSWIIWAVLTSVAFLAQAKTGGAGLWSTGISGLCCGIVAAMAVAYGNRRASRLDCVLFACAMAAVPLWWFTTDPVWALALIILIDGTGFLLTMKKAWAKPYEEMPYAYYMYALSILAAMLALPSYPLLTVIYLSMVLAGNVVIVGIIYGRRAIMRCATPDASRFVRP